MKELDADLLLDNAAACSQVRELIDGPLRECVKLNVFDPMAEKIADLADAALVAEHKMRTAAILLENARLRAGWQSSDEIDLIREALAAIEQAKKGE